MEVRTETQQLWLQILFSAALHRECKVQGFPLYCENLQSYLLIVFFQMHAFGHSQSVKPISGEPLLGLIFSGHFLTCRGLELPSAKRLCLTRLEDLVPGRVKLFLLLILGGDKTSRLILLSSTSILKGWKIAPLFLDSFFILHTLCELWKIM